MQSSRLFLMLLLGCGLFALAACAPEAAKPEATVERYLTAKAAGDIEAMTPLLCSALEASITAEAASFANVEARLDEPACTRIGDSDTVSCSGAFVVNYGTEDTRLPLATYRVTQEDGEWRWCGEAG